ncbi:MAG TPA: hypothetical protein VGC99_02020, partial [Candidatus Tectomicrobia bacterium]
MRLFTKATAMQHARDHIRCHSVHPSPMATEMSKEMPEDPVVLGGFPRSGGEHDRPAAP